MRKILNNGEDTVTLFNGTKTLTKKEIETLLTERVILKRQMEFVENCFSKGGVSQ